MSAVVVEHDPTPTGATHPPPAPTRSARGRWKTVIRLVVSASLVAFLLAQMDLARIGALVGDAHMGFLLLGLASMVVERFYAAYRWLLVLRVHDARVRFVSLLRIMLVCNFWGMFLPGGGIEVLRVAALAKNAIPLGAAAASVGLDRLLGLLTLLLAAVVGCALAGIRLPTEIALPVWGGIVAVAASCVALLWGVVRRRMRRLVPRAVEARVAIAGTYLREVAARPWLLAWAVLLAIGIQIVRVVSVWLIGIALGIELPAVLWFAFVPLTIIAQMMPVGVGGLGVREAAFVFFLGLGGVESEAAFTLSVLVYAMTIVSALPGAWLGTGGLRGAMSARDAFDVSGFETTGETGPVRSKAER